jgi:hypothetical protein
VLLLLALAPGVGPASADGCYPPPCGSPVVTVAGGGTQVHGAAPSRSDDVDDRSAAPLVAAGLLMVTGTLTTLCLRRRAAISALSIVVPPTGVGRLRSPVEHRAPERLLS